MGASICLKFALVMAFKLQVSFTLIYRHLVGA